MKSKKSKLRPKGPSLTNTLLGKSFFFAVIAIIVFFGGLSLFGENGILDLYKLHRVHENLQSENQELLAQQKQLKSQIEQLHSPHHLKYLARERLGLLSANETFIIMDASGSNDTDRL